MHIVCSYLDEKLLFILCTLLQTKYASRDDFQSADQYAMYVRSTVTPGMLVRCCHDFEDIRKGDIGTVLKVDTEGLHDLNVQVDWQSHDSTFWMCFVHIELLEPPKESVPPSNSNYNIIEVGSHVRIRPNISTPRYKWGSVAHGSIGVVTAINGRNVTVDFPSQFNWTGQLKEMELVCQGNPAATGIGVGGGVGSSIGIGPQPDGEIIEDWSR